MLRATIVLGLALLPTVLSSEPPSQEQVSTGSGETIRGTPWTGERGITETVERIMERQKSAPPSSLHVEAEPPRLRTITPRDNPLSPRVSQWPPAKAAPAAEQVLSPQSVGLNLKTIGISESGFIPPDSVGDVGATQILSCTNGRIKTRSKTTGSAGGLNADLNTFFNSVRGGSTPSDSHVRYDRLSGRWFVVSINVTTPNRVLIAVSDASIITSTSSFTFFQFQFDLVGPTPNADTGAFFDYPTLGVDRNALYIGGNVFGGGVRTTGFVVNKADLIAGTLTVTAFRQLMAGGGAAGPWSPQGVDNDDPSATEGYFIGVDNPTFGTLMICRVSDPGGTPSISGNISLLVPLTSSPITQQQMGSTTNIDAIDDRLFAAAIHKNKITGASTLWTAHNIQVTSTGAGCGGACGAGTRNASRWYEIGDLSTTPTLVQSGTLFDSATTDPRGFWIPSVVGTGQGHAVLGSSVASANDFAGVTVSGRLRTDALGSTQGATVVQAGAAPYVLLDPTRNRWGDYSQTEVDPDDDQTVWMFQEYCDASNSWAVRAVQLKAPPPAIPTGASPSSVCEGLPSVEVTITGTSSAGSEFFDPGPDTGGPGYLRRISATVTGGVVVNGVTFTDPTHVTLSLTTVGATTGVKDLTVKNPDRQTATGAGILTVNPAPSAPAASNGGPICEGETLQLQASTVPGVTYGWTGPNGFTSALQNPTIEGATAAASGTYTVIASAGGCSSAAATTTAVVIPSACDDGNPCTTGDVCGGGVCAGTPGGEPSEVDDGARLSQDGGTTTITWNAAFLATAHDVLRGDLAELPVGPDGGDAGEACLADDLAAGFTTDGDDPGLGAGFWYLVRGENACGNGPYGFQGVNGTPTVPRVSATCP